jgi:tetratricopeptide (TPR) repeat protein
MSRKKRSAKSKSAPVVRDGMVSVEYDVTTEPIEDRRHRKLPRAVKDEIVRFHGLVQTDPRQAVAELPQWIKRYPNVPQFYNYLATAYSQVGAFAEVEQTVLENLRRNPDYLFARLNYAELCLGRGDYAAVAETLENKFDLKMLYPNRNRFHISEVVGFMNIVGRYWVGIGQRANAEKYYDLLHKIAPDEPGTQHLHSVLHPGPIKLITQRLAKSILANRK